MIAIIFHFSTVFTVHNQLKKVKALMKTPSSDFTMISLVKH